MKLTVLTALAMSALAFTSVQALETIKILDGKVARCETSQDQYRHRLGAYSFNAEQVKLENDQLRITTNLRFLKCTKQGDLFGFIETTPLATTEFRVVGRTTPVRIVANNAVLRVFRDGVYQLLDEVIIDEKSMSVDINFDLNDLVNESEAQRISDGEKVLVDVDAFLLKNLTIQGLDSDYRSDHAYGAYRIRFTVEKSDNGELIAKKL